MSLSRSAQGVVGETRWRWVLRDDVGVELAVHDVDLDAAAWEFEAAGDLYGYLRRNAVPDWRVTSEAELVDRAIALAPDDSDPQDNKMCLEYSSRRR